MSKFISFAVAHIDKLIISDYLYHATSAGIKAINTTQQLDFLGFCKYMIGLQFFSAMHKLY